MAMVESPQIGELTRFVCLKQRLKEQFPDADEDTLLDTVEGMTNLHEILAEFVRSSLDDLTTSGALKQRIAEMKERLARFETRADKKRAMVLHAMEESGIKKLEDPEFTLSLRSVPASANVIEEGAIPDEYWLPQPAKLDRRKLSDSLRSGKEVPGATLGNGRRTISVRTT